MFNLNKIVFFAMIVAVLPLKPMEIKKPRFSKEFYKGNFEDMGNYCRKKCTKLIYGTCYQKCLENNLYQFKDFVNRFIFAECSGKPHTEYTFEYIDVGNKEDRAKLIKAIENGRFGNSTSMFNDAINQCRDKQMKQEEKQIKKVLGSYRKMSQRFKKQYPLQYYSKKIEHCLRSCFTDC